ncbi:cytochrome c oxidase subunit II [Segetibacter sp. 3557_3]|uniref:cytochrome c oxidase subunit II n=1 Tax=Segetibacter sp. 3557_3 TaxID=2547429 RepID=UPI001058F1B9|nr:cytochrome c oxidase subunit II [Segetibacter sp. 3557_3]TDH24028.1 cytochrome c oxidase subunit II [Segetibacter sp. 3557_3]
MSLYFTIAAVILLFVIIFQIAKASEYVDILKGEERSRKHNNKINGFLMIVFLVLGLIGVYYCHEILKGRLLGESASVEGEKVDSMMNLTIIVTGIVFFITQILLFWFSYKYQEKENRKAFFFPHNNRLEVIWTVIPTIVLTVLVIIGLRNWFLFTGDAPQNAMVVEVTGKQFGWIYRYPGKDNEFGKKYFRNIDDATNWVGLVWADNAEMNQKADPAAKDDIVLQQTMYVVKNKPVKLVIGSRDVIHDVGLPHFRLKMDAVPGIPTSLWFTPKFTTAEMQKSSGNPNFEYEIACDQICGNNHFAMKGIIRVVTQEEFDVWLAQQKPLYLTAFPDNNPATVPGSPATNPAGAAPADSAKNATAVTMVSNERKN